MHASAKQCTTCYMPQQNSAPLWANVVVAAACSSKATSYLPKHQLWNAGWITGAWCISGTADLGHLLGVSVWPSSISPHMRPPSA